MEDNSKSLTEQVTIEDTNQPENMEFFPQLEAFKAYIMKTISDMIDQKIKAATDNMWLRLQNTEAQVEINTKTGAGNLAIVKNHVHVNQ